VISSLPGTAAAASAKPSNTPLPANAHVKFNMFDVRIIRKANEVIGLDIKVNREHGTVVTKVSAVLQGFSLFLFSFLPSRSFSFFFSFSFLFVFFFLFQIHECSPASSSGLILIGDQIVKIDGKNIAGMTTAMVIEVMRELKENFVFSFRRV